MVGPHMQGCVVEPFDVDVDASWRSMQDCGSIVFAAYGSH